MTGSALLYLALAAALFGLGVGGALLHRDPLRRLLAINVMGLGVFTALVTRPDAGTADPVAQALVITGLVVAVAATAVGLALIRRGAAPDRPPAAADKGAPSTGGARQSGPTVR